ncbi:MAG: lipopolysaccharide assembly protein LapB [Pseudohongiellaceae bacterium]
MTEINFLLFLLLVLAVGVGWLLARLTSLRPQAGKRSLTRIYHDYFVGLNYLLRDEPDEAIDTFIRALEVNGDTAETHLALGTLLRRRGKVDKAIHVHQTLLARPSLDAHFADAVKLELATDYIAAGLLDRAERLLKEMLEIDSNAKLEALRQLMTIYQTEKEWHQAIGCVEKLLQSSPFKKDAVLHGTAAHYCCELADQAMEHGQLDEVREYVKKAFQFDRHSVRAAFLAAAVEQSSGDYQKAIKELALIRQQQPEFISELIKPMAECYAKLGEIDEFGKFLQACLDEEPRVSVILELAKLVRQQQGETAAVEFLSSKMTRYPSLKGMTALLELQANECSGALRENLLLLKSITERWLARKPGYRCNQCGFETRSLYWQCPSCQRWDTVKPILGIEGE